ncbi:MAG: hypothetical protein ACRCZF_01535 [Gemmataceae bacterium]
MEPIPVAIPIAVPVPVAVRVAERAPSRPPAPLARRATLQKARGFFGTLAAGIGWLHGLAMLILGLAVLSASPVLQFLSLGYMLEAAGRVARTGRLRDGFIGVRTAGHLGGIFLATWLLLLPVRLVADLARHAEVLDPGSRLANQYRTGLFLLMGAVFFHAFTAVARGGRFRNFLNPFNAYFLLRKLWRGGWYAESRDAVWMMLLRLRLPHYFQLGFKGFLVGFVWLALPATLLGIGHETGDGKGFIGLIGAILLAMVLVYLPFLQVRLAMTDRWREGFRLRAVRADFRRAPFAFAIAFLVAVLFAMPLYIFKVEVIPAEAAWLPGLIFIAFIYPARLLAGWAVARAQRRERPRHWFFRWLARPFLLIATLSYVGVVFLAQYATWNGVGVLYEQHAFLLPVPFVAL